MPLRPEVQELVDLGPIPGTIDADEHDLDRRAALIAAIKDPVTYEEAVALLTCFGPDDGFGLNWGILHIIETTPGGIPLSGKPDPSDNEWVRLLWDRSHRTFR
jgi:hypothetical protein